MWPTRSILLPLFSLALTTACGASGWTAGPTTLADPRAVAAALGDPPPERATVDAGLPLIEPPGHARMCCAFGMDLEVDFVGMHVPFFSVGNVLDAGELGRHAYALPSGAPDTEGNGLVYTCRGGWVDVAHVREQADTVLFLALHMAADPTSETTIVVPGHGGTTTIVVAPIPRAVVEREGALAIGAALAAWTAWRTSIWHEVSTWYGYEMVSGFSERPSAFSLEDLYSNALGIRLALAVLAENGFRTDEEYDLVMDAFLTAVLERMEVQPREVARAIMSALDGRWWDSTRRLPDDLLVRKRAFPPDDEHVRPWRAESAFAPDELPPELVTACRGARTRTLVVPSGVGHVDASDVVSITWAPEGWGAALPGIDPDHGIVEERDLDRLVAATHEGLREVLGPGFDRPEPSPAPAPSEPAP